MDDLKLLVLDNIVEIGHEVDEYLKEMNNQKDSYIMDITRSRFNNGEGKIRINETIRDKDVFILSDVGNYGITYEMHDHIIPMSPDEHCQDIKRSISALSGYARRITVLMPLLYQSRQDKREGRESLDCSMALQELERLKINHLLTFDCHNRQVANAIPNLPFENFFPTNRILEDLIVNENICDDTIVVAPDEGALKRARFYADMLRCNVGSFYKRRDVTKLVDGKNPIVEHKYMGTDVNGKTVIVVDDMIASGASIIDVGKKLKEEYHADKIFFITTFALFTEGIDTFNEAYKKEYFNKLYTTNLSYIPESYKKNKWLEIVNCSKRIAEIIDCIHKGNSLGKIVDGKEGVFKLLDEKKRIRKK